VPGIFSFLAQHKSLICNTLFLFVPLVPLVPAFLSSFTDLKDIPILFFKSNFNLKMLAHLAQMATAPVNPHFLLAQTWHKAWHRPPVSGTNPQIIDPNDNEPRFIDLDSRFTLIGRF
jgi:hypothetical protein